MGSKLPSVSTLTPLSKVVPQEPTGIKHYHRETLKAEHTTFLKNLRHYLRQYSNNTTIHGVRFLGERNRALVERLWWLIFLLTSLSFCALLIFKTYQKWERSPVLVSFATSETPISEIPFPAITICPETKARKAQLNFTQMFMLKRRGSVFDEVTERQYAYMLVLCRGYYNTRALMQPKESVDEGIMEFIMELQLPSLHGYCESEEFCYHQVSRLPFKNIITSEGLCYSFNMLDINEIFTDAMAKAYYKSNSTRSKEEQLQWTLEKGYTNKSIKGVFPRRTVASGEDGGFSFNFIINESDLDFLCRDGLQGYKVILHQPAQFPNAKQGYFRIGLDKFTSVSVTPHMMTTSKALLDYDPEIRKCYFASERNLRFFKVYNQQNCIMECLSDFTHKYCNCVEFYMPRDNSTPICDRKSDTCVIRARERFHAKDLDGIEQDFKWITYRPKDGKGLNFDCNCMPSCYSLDYATEVSQVEWNWKEGYKILDWPQNNLHMTKLQVFFKDTQFITSERNELYGQTDFLANCGGLLGLFTGFSFISLVEILYFGTLRLFCNVRKYGRHQWSGEETSAK